MDAAPTYRPGGVSASSCGHRSRSLDRSIIDRKKHTADRERVREMTDTTSRMVVVGEEARIARNWDRKRKERPFLQVLGWHSPQMLPLEVREAERQIHASNIRLMDAKGWRWRDVYPFGLAMTKRMRWAYTNELEHAWQLRDEELQLNSHRRAMGEELLPARVSSGPTLSLDEKVDIEQAKAWDKHINDEIADADMDWKIGFEERETEIDEVDYSAFVNYEICPGFERAEKHQRLKIAEYYAPEDTFIAAMLLEEDLQLEAIVDEYVREEDRAKKERASLIDLDSELRAEELESELRAEECLIETQARVEEEQLSAEVDEYLDEKAATDRASLLKLDAELQRETEVLFSGSVEQDTEMYMRRFYWKDNVPMVEYTDPTPDEMFEMVLQRNIRRWKATAASKLSKLVARMLTGIEEGGSSYEDGQYWRYPDRDPRPARCCSEYKDALKQQVSSRVRKSVQRRHEERARTMTASERVAHINVLIQDKIDLEGLVKLGAFQAEEELDDIVAEIDFEEALTQYEEDQCTPPCDRAEDYLIPNTNLDHSDAESDDVRDRWWRVADERKPVGELTAMLRSVGPPTTVPVDDSD